MAQKTCPVCGGAISEWEKPCPHCGIVPDNTQPRQGQPSFGGGTPPGQQPGFGGHTPPGQQPGFDSNTPPGQQPGFDSHTQPGQQPGFDDYAQPGQQPGFDGYAPPGQQPGFGGYTPPPGQPGYGAYSQPYGGADNRPVSVSSYLGHYLLYCIPIAGIIIAIIHMRDASRPLDFRNFAKGVLILQIVYFCIIALFTGCIITTAMAEFTSNTMDTVINDII